MSPLLSIKNLTTWFETGQGQLRAVDGISIDIAAGEVFALLGESGSGKSLTALSIMRLLPPTARSSGQILLHDVAPGILPPATLVRPCTSRDLLRLPEVKMREVRGGRIAMIFQEPMTSLNPVLTVGTQIGEALKVHRGLKERRAEQRAIELLDAVGIPEPQRRIHDYPHQLSGGMKQRVMIAIALAGEPELLIADEPTTALDVTIQAQILELLRKLQKDIGMTILLITHDLGVVSAMADRVAVMYAGQVVELAARAQFFAEPQHPYTKKLFDSLPGFNKRGKRLTAISGSVPSLAERPTGCRFTPRCNFAWQTCRDIIPRWTGSVERGVLCHLYDPAYSAARPADAGTQVSADFALSPPPEEMAVTSQEIGAEQALLEIRDLKVYFPIRKGLLQRVAGYVRAVDGVSLTIKPAQTLALVGESGSGKTTVGKGILQLVTPTAGSVRFAGLDLRALRGEALRRQRANFQIIFQDPYSSLNPRMMVSDILKEGMQALRIGTVEEHERRVDELLEQVGLEAELKYRYPHEFSGGQRQRICIARALAVNPKLIICDEPTSALDVSVQAQILNLLKTLQERLGIAYLFITHNIAVVEYLAHEVAVMYQGKIVEHGPTEAVLLHASHPYTRTLLNAVPRIEGVG
ncbi:MAG TPA: ABC transporter ATP-binding protein [Gammaproteobacteria bacterium]|nr:ABC transporter ATP-binding protein [Gammaproteobacteria bacterium]